MAIEERQTGPTDAEAGTGEGTDEAAAVPAYHQGSEAVGEDVGNLVPDLLARSLELGEGDDPRAGVTLGVGEEIVDVAAILDAQIVDQPGSAQGRRTQLLAATRG